MFICILKAFCKFFLYSAFNFNYNFIMLGENPFYVIFQKGQTGANTLYALAHTKALEHI